MPEAPGLPVTAAPAMARRAHRPSGMGERVALVVMLVELELELRAAQARGDGAAVDRWRLAVRTVERRARRVVRWPLSGPV